jgi:hypothetical protein
MSQDRVVNEALARVYTSDLGTLSPIQQRHFEDLRDGNYEVVGDESLRLDGGIIKTRWTSNLIRAIHAFDAHQHLAEIVTNWDQADRVYSHYLSGRTLKGAEYKSPDFGVNARILRLGIELLKRGGEVSSVMLAGATSPNSIRQALAFLEIYELDKVIVADKDPFLFEMCVKDDLNGVNTSLCDFFDLESMPEYDIAISSNTLQSVCLDIGWERASPMFLNWVMKARRGVVAVEYMNLGVVLENLEDELSDHEVYFNWGFPRFVSGLSYDQLRASSYEEHSLEDANGSFSVVAKQSL